MPIIIPPPPVEVDTTVVPDGTLNQLLIAKLNRPQAVSFSVISSVCPCSFSVKYGKYYTTK